MLYATPMVQAIQEDRKTKTRRTRGLEDLVIYTDSGYIFFKKHTVKLDIHTWKEEILKYCPYGQIGDLLWVKETFYAFGHWIEDEETNKWSFVDETLIRGLSYCYYDNPPQNVRIKRTEGACYWYKRPSLFMPKVAARIWLEITDVRVERLKDISEIDCIAEGIEHTATALYQGHSEKYYKDYCNFYSTEKLFPAESFKSLWISINGEDSWSKNHWVWVISFKKVNKPS